MKMKRSQGEIISAEKKTENNIEKKQKNKKIPQKTVRRMIMWMKDDDSKAGAMMAEIKHMYENHYHVFAWYNYVFVCLCEVLLVRCGSSSSFLLPRAFCVPFLIPPCVMLCVII